MQVMTRLLSGCRIGAVILGVAAATGTAQAQSVIFSVTGNAYARDYYGGEGIVDNDLPALLGGTLDSRIDAVAGEASASVMVSASNGIATTSLTTVAASDFISGFNFFIYRAVAQVALTPYILGGPGTPYRITLHCEGLLDESNGGAGTLLGEGQATGNTDPGWLFDWGLSGGDFVYTGVTDNHTVVHGGQVFSRVLPMPHSDVSAYFGLTGNPRRTGFSSIATTMSIVTSVEITAAPEPATLLLLAPSLLALACRRYRRAR